MCYANVWYRIAICKTGENINNNKQIKQLDLQIDSKYVLNIVSGRTVHNFKTLVLIQLVNN